MIHLSLLLQSAQVAFVNGQMQQGMFLLNYATKLADDPSCLSPLSSLDAAIGLDRGLVRESNEDCAVALRGMLPETQDVFGLFVICDGMGGHAHGQEAAHLAIQTLLEHVFPFLMQENAPSCDWGQMLVEGVEMANRVISLRNRLMQQTNALQVARGIPTTQISQMGTTITAAFVIGNVAYIVNVGDSRAYLYTPESGLGKVTQDHSVVATLLAKGIIEEEEMYTHFQRNQITRAVGMSASVEVDTFTLSLPQDAILLLCSDGLWEMTRDPGIEQILTSRWASAASMANGLVQLAKDGGGADNIGCIVVQMQPRTDISAMATTLLDPVGALTRLVTPS